MNKEEVISNIQAGTEQEKEQFAAVQAILTEAIQKEMPTFKKLIQHDTMAAILKRSEGESDLTFEGIKKMTKMLDEFVQQFNDNMAKMLESEIAQVEQSMK